jgi:hypothetical protein
MLMNDDEMRRELRELREDLALLRLAQERLENVTMLNAALSGLGVIGYEGPCLFDLPKPTVCVICGARINHLGYELQLHRGRAHLCKGCFSEVTST